MSALVKRGVRLNRGQLLSVVEQVRGHLSTHTLWSGHRHDPRCAEVVCITREDRITSGHLLARIIRCNKTMHQWITEACVLDIAKHAYMKRCIS